MKSRYLFFKSHSFSSGPLEHLQSRVDCPATIREEEIMQAIGLLYPTRQGPKESALVDFTLSIRTRLDDVWMSLPTLTVL